MNAWKRKVIGLGGSIMYWTKRAFYSITIDSVEFRQEKAFDKRAFQRSSQAQAS